MWIYTHICTHKHTYKHTQKTFLSFWRGKKKFILETQESHNILIILNSTPSSIYKPFMICQKMMPSTYRKSGFTNSRWPSITFLVMAWFKKKQNKDCKNRIQFEVSNHYNSLHQPVDLSFYMIEIEYLLIFQIHVNKYILLQKTCTNL